jgi:hypothetical protein
MSDFPKWPSWRFGPNGEAEIFECEEQVPEGWLDSPAKFDEQETAPTPRPRGRPRKEADETQF